jgi:hypothetical protein
MLAAVDYLLTNISPSSSQFTGSAVPEFLGRFATPDPDTAGNALTSE